MALAALPASASSISIAFEDSDIAGLSITLTNQGLVSGTTSWYNILLSVDTTTSYANQGDTLAPDLLTAISFDLSGSSVTAALVSDSGGAGTTWTLVQDTQVNNGTAGDCQGPSAGQPCIQEDQSVSLAGNLVLTAATANYWWQFQVDLLGGSFSDSTSVQAFIMDLERDCKTRAGVTTCDGFKGLKKAEVFSATLEESLADNVGGGTDPVVAAVPEPGSLILLGTGLTLAASRFRRRRT